MGDRVHNAQRAIIIEERDNPSTDYFVAPELQGSGVRLERYNWQEVAPAATLSGALIVFVRYVPPAWRRAVEAARSRLAGIVYFMDDDIFDTSTSTGLSFRYRYKLARFGAWNQAWLRRVGADLWVASPWLAKKYSQWQPRIICPIPPPQTWSNHPVHEPNTAVHEKTPYMQCPDAVCRVFYHGTASHRDDIAWLYPVIREVLKRAPNVHFEISGDDAIRRKWRDLTRVNVIAPMKWPAYQAFMDQPGRHIGLAPLVEHPFNRARSYTKFFDITRAGAAGIYANHGPWRDMLVSGREGVMLPMQPDAWVNTIIALANDPQRRLDIAAHAQALARRLATP